MPCCTVQPLPAIRCIPISNHLTTRTELLQGELVHGITELFASNALEAVTLAVLMLVDACCCLDCPALICLGMLSPALAVRANTAQLSPITWKRLERCLSQKQLIQPVDPLQLLRCMRNVICDAEQYY